MSGVCLHVHGEVFEVVLEAVLVQDLAEQVAIGELLGKRVRLDALGHPHVLVEPAAQNFCHY